LKIKLPLNLNFGNVVRREYKKFLNEIKKEENLLENKNILKEFKRNNLTLLKIKGLSFLVKEFQSFNRKKRIDSIILINIGFLSNTMKSGIQFKDIDFLNFIINLLYSEDLFKYGLISFHLFLNRYIKYERSIHGYNNYFFHELIKEIDKNKRDFLYQIIIEGLINNKEIEKNPDHFFEILDNNLSTDYKTISNLTYNLYFTKIFKANAGLLKKYEDQLFGLVESNITQIFQKGNVFTVFKHIYVNFYNEEREIFQKIDDYFEKNIENFTFFNKLIDFICNFMPKNGSHPFYKKFYKKYFDLSYQLKDQRKFYELGLLWARFNIRSLKDPQNGELIDKEYFKKLIDDFKIVLHSGESPLFNARYMEIEELLELRPIVEPIETFENTRQIVIELIDYDESRIKDVDTKHPECDNKLNNQLKALNFWDLNAPLSKNADTWLEIIGKFFDILKVCYDHRVKFREPAQNWKDEKKDMNPWMSTILTFIFHNKHKDESLVSDGDADHWIEEIPVEDKLLKTEEKLDNENIIKEKYEKHKKQILREAGKCGYAIFVIADIRKEIKNNEIPARPLKKCFQIFYENNIWIAAFLFQAFTKPPSGA